MTTATYRAPSANELFKAQYNKYMRWAMLGALLFTIMFFLFSPKYKPNPFKLYEDQMEYVEIQEQVEIPDVPKAPPKPQVTVEPVPDELADDDVDVADSLLDADELIEFGDGMEITDGGFEVSQDKPVLMSFSQPEYPEIARASHLQGTVLVKVQVGTDGSVLQALVIKSVHPTLDREAVRAAKRCKFKPGRQRGIPVKAWMAIPFAFTLN